MAKTRSVYHMCLFKAMGSPFDLKFGRVCRGKLSREGQRRVCQIYTEDPDPLIPEYPKILSIPDPAPKVAPYPASGKP